MKKFEILKLEKKAITKLNDQQIMALKGGLAISPSLCITRTSTVNCSGAGSTVIN
jgi:hypothetical protein